MYVAPKIQARLGTSTIRPARKPRTASLAPVFPGGMLLASFTLLAACGDTTGPQDIPIPEKMFEVTMSSPSNNCQLATDLGSFRFVTRPQHVGDNSYNLLGMLDSPVSAQLTGDKLVFQAPIAVENGVATLGADWRFSAARQSFTGSTTLDVRANNGNTCVFTFATAGVLQVVSSRGNVPSSSQPSGAAVAARSTALSSAASAATASAADGIGSVPAEFKTGVTGTIYNSLPVECRPDGIIVWGGSQGGLQVGDANLTGSNPVAVTVFFQGYDPVSGTLPTAGWWAFGGDQTQSGPVQAPNHEGLSVRPAESQTVGIFYGGYLGAMLVPVRVGSTPAVVASVPTVRFVNPPAGWYKVWVRYEWSYAGGSLVGSAWLVFNDAQAYLGLGAQVATNGWCYVSG
jgi:hypothetical protein